MADCSAIPDVPTMLLPPPTSPIPQVPSTQERSEQTAVGAGRR